MKKHVLAIVVLHAHHVGLVAQGLVKDVAENVKVVVEEDVKITVLSVVAVVVEAVIGHAKVVVKKVVVIWRIIMNDRIC